MSKFWLKISIIKHLFDAKSASICLHLECFIIGILSGNKFFSKYDDLKKQTSVLRISFITFGLVFLFAWFLQLYIFILFLCEFFLYLRQIPAYKNKTIFANHEVFIINRYRLDGFTAMGFQSRMFFDDRELGQILNPI